MFLEYYLKDDDNADLVQNAMKNSKMAIFLQKQHSEDVSNRVGVASPGDTRWHTRREQMEKQFDQKGTMVNMTMDDEWKQYIDSDIRSIVRDADHWDDVKNLLKDVTECSNAIKVSQGHSVCASQCYYEMTKLLIFAGHYKDSDDRTQREMSVQ